MFATVNTSAGAARRAVTVPNTAIVYNPYGSAVFLVDHANPPTVHQTLVKTGQTRGDQVEVLSGLKTGDIIVTSGQIKLHDGSAIAVNNSVQPANEAAPTPADE
jgi:membrane fusion protein (multidrug efflux system)